MGTTNATSHAFATFNFIVYFAMSTAVVCAR